MATEERFRHLSLIRTPASSIFACGQSQGQDLHIPLRIGSEQLGLLRHAPLFARSHSSNLSIAAVNSPRLFSQAGTIQFCRNQ